MVARQAHGDSDNGDAKVQSGTSQWAPSLGVGAATQVPHCADRSGDNDCGYVSELAPDTERHSQVSNEHTGPHRQSPETLRQTRTCWVPCRQTHKASLT